MTRLHLTMLGALPAAAQPLSNPAIFARRGFGLGGFVVGAFVGGIVFALFKNAGDRLRWRQGKPMLGKAVITAGAAAGLVLFYAIAFKL